jgi:hypothetical protein
VLLAYLAQLRTNPAPGPLQPRLAAVYPAAEETLEQHLARLDPAGQAVIPTAQR